MYFKRVEHKQVFVFAGEFSHLVGGWESSCPNRLHVGHSYGAQHGSSSKAMMILAGKRKCRRKLATGSCRIFPKARGRVSCGSPRPGPPLLLLQVPSSPWPNKHVQVVDVGWTILCSSASSAWLPTSILAATRLQRAASGSVLMDWIWLGSSRTCHPLTLLGFNTKSVEGVLLDSGHVPSGLCPFPGGLANPHQHGWPMAGNIWFIRHQAGQKIRQIMLFPVVFQKSKIRKKSEYKDRVMYFCLAYTDTSTYPACSIFPFLELNPYWLWSGYAWIRSGSLNCF